jgi:outer membrane immunogenic protein
MTKSLLLGSAGLVALAVLSPALAADLPVKAAPPVVALYDWTGVYIGINAGATLSEKRWDYLGPLQPTGNDGAHNFTGVAGGAQIGFNYQVGRWVFGAEAQGDWGRAQGTSDSLLFFNQTNRTLIDAYGLVNGRLGYALDNVLFYAKGGVGVVHEKYDVFATDTGITFASGSETRWGPAAGLGFELAFSDHVSIAGEYNHVFLGNRDISFTPTGDVYRIRQDLDVFAVKLNYRFNGR